MKVLLLHRDRDFDLKAPEPANEQDLMQDLELETLLLAMAAGDQRVFDVAKVALLHPLFEPEEIRFRQAVLADCMANPDVVHKLYALALAALQAERGFWGFWKGSPESALASSRRPMADLTGRLAELREVADTHVPQFESEGFRRLFATLQAELSDEYLALVKDQLETLEFKSGLLMSARLGRGNKGTDYVLRLTPQRSWRDRLAQLRRSGHSFDINPRDEASGRALSELRGLALNETANALTQSVDHIKSFFRALATELAFYIGCLNLDQRLTELGAASCRPEPADRGSLRLGARGLYEVSLTLRLQAPAVGNDVSGDGKQLVIVTGANQGGKSTFMRSLGLAQLMMQSGMHVGAQSFEADVRRALFTHYKREEDATMESGKLDEELMRMGAIAEQITPDSMLLCNESFAATNEREGSEIARQVVRALGETGVKVVFVTHLFDFADGIRREQRDDVLFLRAPRGENGRTYRLSEGDPLPTSYGEDTYREVFGVS